MPNIVTYTKAAAIFRVYKEAICYMVTEFPELMGLSDDDCNKLYEATDKAYEIEKNIDLTKYVMNDYPELQEHECMEMFYGGFFNKAGLLTNEDASVIRKTADLLKDMLSNQERILSKIKPSKPKERRKPFRYEDAKRMFEYVTNKLSKHPCDNTLKFTTMWLKKHFNGNMYFVRDAILFLQEHGGYCDCEVLLNTDKEEYWK